MPAEMSAPVEPRILQTTDDYFALYKPAGLHTAPLRENEGPTLLSWLLERHPEIRDVSGAKPVEPGLLHRLDRETAGIVLVARTSAAFDAARRAAEHDRFRKWYYAESVAAVTLPPGCRDRLVPRGLTAEKWGAFVDGIGRHRVPAAEPDWPIALESAFRPYGPGRRIVAVNGSPGADARIYRTELHEFAPTATGAGLFLSLSRGFRHQIRVHLSSSGLPIIGDDLYGVPAGETKGGSGQESLRLLACRIELTITGEETAGVAPDLEEVVGAAPKTQTRKLVFSLATGSGSAVTHYSDFFS